MKKNRLFLYIISAVLVSGIVFSLYVIFKIRTIRNLRTSAGSISSEAAVKAGHGTASENKPGKNIPSKMWAAEFIEIAYDKANRVGIRNLVIEQKSKDISPANITAQHSSRKIRSYPARISFSSGYREMAEFIRELQSMDRLVTIEGLKIKGEKSSLAVDITVVTYSMEAK